MPPIQEGHLDEVVGRAKWVASLQLAPALSLAAYGSRAVPIVGYLGQIFRIPRQLLRQELARLHHLLHLPCGTFSLRAFVFASEK